MTSGPLVAASLFLHILGISAFVPRFGLTPSRPLAPSHRANVITPRTAKILPLDVQEARILYSVFPGQDIAELQKNYPLYDIENPPDWATEETPTRLEAFRNAIRVRTTAECAINGDNCARKVNQYDWNLELDNNQAHRTDKEGATCIFATDEFGRVILSAAKFVPQERYLTTPEPEYLVNQNIRKNREPYSDFLVRIGAAKNDSYVPALLWPHELNYLSSGITNDDPLNIVPFLKATKYDEFRELRQELVLYMREGANITAEVAVRYHTDNPDTKFEGKPARLEYEFTVDFPERKLTNLWVKSKTIHFEIDNDGRSQSDFGGASAYAIIASFDW